MNKRLLFILCLTIGLGNIAFAQTKTVTNADLEKFRQKRLQADRDLRENYEKLGFPSPEELQKRNEQRRTELERLSNQLRQEELQKELLQSQQSDEFRSQNDNWNGQSDNYPSYSTGVYTYGYPSFGYSNYYQPFFGYKTGLRLRLNYGNKYPQRNTRPIGGGYAFPSAFDNRPRNYGGGFNRNNRIRTIRPR